MELVETLTGHKSDVRDMILLRNNNLASCSYDKTIKIWSIKPNNYKCLCTFTKHTKKVLSLYELSVENVLVSGSLGDHTLRFWDYVK